jgi:hypothetical protein
MERDTQQTQTPTPAENPDPAQQPAQPSQPAQPAQPQMETSNAPQPTIPEAPAPGQQAPVVLRPAKRGGLLGVIDDIANVMAGKTTPEIYTDDTGQKYIQHPTMTRGQQWLKIGREALAGSAAGLAAGKGAGNGGRALYAGVREGEQQNQQQRADYAQQQQEVHQSTLDIANSQMLKQQMAANQMAMTRMQIKGQREDSEYYARRIADEKALGSSDMGVVKNLAQLADLRHLNPDIIKHMVEDNRIEVIPAYDADANPVGIHVFLRNPGVGSELVPNGTKARFAVPGEKPGDPYRIVEQELTSPTTRDQLSAINNQADAKYQQSVMDLEKLKSEQAGTAEKNAQAGKATAETTEVPSKIALNKSSTAKNYAEANKANQETATAQQAHANATNPRFETLAQGMVDGDILPGDLKREAKGAGLDPNEILGHAMELAKTQGVKFSIPILEQEHKFASSVKTQAAIDGIDRMIGTATNRGMLDSAIDVAKKAGLSGSAPINSMALPIRRMFGEKAVKDFYTMVSETRRSISGLIGNPLLGGGETDKKLEQADTVLGQNPTLDNITSSAELLKTALQTQRDNLVNNNRYLKQRYGSGKAQPAQQQQQQQQAPAAAAPAAPPPGATHIAPGTDGHNHYTDATGKDLGVAP